MEVTDNTKTLTNALAEIEQLSQKLEAAEAQRDEWANKWQKVVSYGARIEEKLEAAEAKIAEYDLNGWADVYTVESTGVTHIRTEIYNNLVSERGAFEQVISEAQEQTPFRFFVADSRIGSEDMYPANSKFEYEHGVTVLPMYLSPVPAIQKHISLLDMDEVNQLAYEYGHNEDGSGYILSNEEFENCINLAIKLSGVPLMTIQDEEAELRRKLEFAEAEVLRLKEDNHNGLLSYVDLANKREMRVSGLQDRVREALDRASCAAAFMAIAIDTIGLHGCGEIADTHKKLEEAQSIIKSLYDQKPAMWSVRNRNGELYIEWVEGAPSDFDRSEVERVGGSFEFVYAHPVPEIPIQAHGNSQITSGLRHKLIWLLWHHQGGKSDIGQPIRKLLGIGQFESLTDEQVEIAKSQHEVFMNHFSQAQPSPAMPIQDDKL